MLESHEYAGFCKTLEKLFDRPGANTVADSIWRALVKNGYAKEPPPKLERGKYLVRWWRYSSVTLASYNLDVCNNFYWEVEKGKDKWRASLANGFPKEPFEIIKKVDL